MYFLDGQHHSVPHIHARHSGYEASTRVDDGEVLVGSCRVSSCGSSKHGLNCIEMSSWPIGSWLRRARIRTKLLHCEVVMYWDVQTVRPLDDYEIYVELEDGRK